MLTIVEAMAVIKKYQEFAPINIMALVSEFGLKVYEVADRDDGFSGMIVRDETDINRFSIYINQKHKPVRKRFTIAHELAHFIYHRDLIGDGIVDNGLYRSGLSNEQESMANGLAADILMPWHLLNIEIQNGEDSIEKLAEKFNVSFTAMAIRLGMPC